jgi:toxin ParE1/3/4
MASVIWTFQAQLDMAEIAEYHDQKSEKYSKFLVNRFLQCGEQLEKFPFMGRVLPEINLKSIREIIVDNYRMIYAVPSSDKVNILAVRHSSIPLGNFPIEIDD